MADQSNSEELPPRSETPKMEEKTAVQSPSSAAIGGGAGIATNAAPTAGVAGARTAAVIPEPAATNAAAAAAAKYKQLLTMARSSIQAKQEEIVEKEKTIATLRHQLDELKASSTSSSLSRSSKYNPNSSGGGASGSGGAGAGDSDSNTTPRQLLRLVEDDNRKLWVLCDYGVGSVPSGSSSSSNSSSSSSSSSSSGYSWLCFDSHADLDDFIARQSTSGPPLLKPVRLLSAEESARIEQEGRTKCDQITEEFRRFKVRVEIARKQKDAEVKQQLMMLRNGGGSGSGAGGSNGVKNGSNSAGAAASSLEMLLASSLASPLSAVASSAPAAAECSQCARLKEEVRQLNTALNRYMLRGAAAGANDRDHGGATGASSGPSSATGALMPDSGGTAGAGSGGGRDFGGTFSLSRAVISPGTGGGGKSFQAALRGAGGSTNSLDSFASRDSQSTDGTLGDGEHRHQRSSRHGSTYHPKKSSSSSGPDAMELSKNQYARQMLFQYLTCKDIVVKAFIEDALCKLFRYTDDEQAAIEDRRRMEMGDAGVATVGGSHRGKGKGAAAVDSSILPASLSNLLGFG